MDIVNKDIVRQVIEKKEAKWLHLQAAVTPDFKDEVMQHCHKVIGFDYSTTTRIIWLRILARYQDRIITPKDQVKEIQEATDEVIYTIPIFRKQHEFNKKLF